VKGKAVFLKKSHKDGKTYLSITKGYREGGKSKSRTVKGLGYLDDLEKEHADPVSHFKAVAKEMTERENEQYAPVAITIHPAQRIDKRQEGQRKNIGCAVLLAHYNSLSIERTLRNAGRGRGFGYDANAIMRLLVIERAFHPGSKRAALRRGPGYFFRADFTEDDVYRCLDFFAECKEAVVAAMNRAIALAGTRDTATVFYDVTNYYFETETQDGLRRVGANKSSNKPKKPIVQMGLLQDANAIPITFKTFAGNTNDCTTLLPALKELKRGFDLRDVVVVADKGINTSDNIAACILDGNDFVFSQSVKGTKSTDELRRWVIDEAGYKEGRDGTFKKKSRQDMKRVTIKDGEGKTVKGVDIEVKVVAFWSKKYEVRARKKRAEVIARAEMLVKNPSEYNKKTHLGAARYVKNITFDKKTGEILADAGKRPVLDEQAIRDSEACDGYYCIITSKTDWPTDKVIDVYKGLWKIEEAFKITKSDIASRPAYVWKKEHIEAHFLTCYIALTLLRLIQYETGFAYSAGSIIGELAAMSGTNEDGNWWLFDHRSDLSDLLCSSVGIDLTKKRMKLEDIKKVLAQVSGKRQNSTTRNTQ
jgi:transposase